MRTLLVILCAFGMFSTAAAQAPGSVGSHYRAYVAALERGDDAGAAAEAAAALEASIALHGDGARTGVLALNLALARIAIGAIGEAVEPAERALRISTTRGEESGVDPRHAKLVLARARMHGDKAAREELFAALDSVAEVPDFADDAYEAAVDLASSLLKDKEHEKSADAWRRAQTFARGADRETVYRRLEAKIGEGATLVLMDGDRRLWREGLVSESAGAKGQVLLAEAMNELRPFAEEEPASGDLTQAQALFGQAYVLHSAWSAKAGLGNANRAPGLPKLGRASGENICGVSILRAEPDFPDRGVVEGGVGATLVKIKIDSEGNLVRTQLAGSAGGAAFSDAVLKSLRRARVTPSRESDPYCKLPTSYFQSFSFLYDD